LRGSLVAATADGPVRWKTSGGQEISFSRKRLAGIRFAALSRPVAEIGLAALELRNGDSLRGEISSFDGTTLAVKLPSFGMIQIAGSQLWKIYPNAQDVKYSGSRSAEEMLSCAFDDRQKKADPQLEREPAILFDGCMTNRSARAGACYLFDGEKLDSSGVVAGSGRYQISFDLTAPEGNWPPFALWIDGSSGERRLSISYFGNSVEVDRSPGSGLGVTEMIRAGALGSRINVELFVDSQAHTVDMFLDGVLQTQLGRGGDNGLSQLGRRVVLTFGEAYQSFGMRHAAFGVVSNIQIHSWDGVFRESDGQPKVFMHTIGPFEGTVVRWSAGRMVIDWKGVPFERDSSEVAVVDFGGVFAPRQSAARIRLLDGETINLDAFHVEGESLVAHSETLGELWLPLNSLSELVVHPALPRSPAPLRLR
jgi:hypothetical protein